MVAHNKEVMNWVKKNEETRMPAQNAICASSSNCPKPLTIKRTKGVDTFAHRNSPSIVIESTIIDRVGRGVAYTSSAGRSILGIGGRSVIAAVFWLSRLLARARLVGGGWVIHGLQPSKHSGRSGESYMRIR
jgi:hypothetical protein